MQLTTGYRHGLLELFKAYPALDHRDEVGLRGRARFGVIGLCVMAFDATEYYGAQIYCLRLASSASVLLRTLSLIPLTDI